MTAQKCNREGCFNKTNDPCGSCYLHRGVRRPASQRATALSLVPPDSNQQPIAEKMDAEVPVVGDIVLRNGLDKYYARKVTRIHPDGSVEVRLPGGNHAHYEAGTFDIITNNEK